MKKVLKQNLRRELRKRRVHAVILGSAARPRLTVFRSNKYTYAQLIDDTAGKTLASASTRDIKEKIKKSDLASKLGEVLAEKTKKSGVKKIVFDRGPYRFHGRVKAVLESFTKSINK